MRKLREGNLQQLSEQGHPDGHGAGVAAEWHAGGNWLVGL